MRRELATPPAWVLSRGIEMAKTENRKPKTAVGCRAKHPLWYQRECSVVSLSPSPPQQAAVVRGGRRVIKVCARFCCASKTRNQSGSEFGTYRLRIATYRAGDAIPIPPLGTWDPPHSHLQANFDEALPLFLASSLTPLQLLTVRAGLPAGSPRDLPLAVLLTGTMRCHIWYMVLTRC